MNGKDFVNHQNAYFGLSAHPSPESSMSSLRINIPEIRYEDDGNGLHRILLLFQLSVIDKEKTAQ
jgi:hypothetical protein